MQFNAATPLSLHGRIPIAAEFFLGLPAMSTRGTKTWKTKASCGVRRRAAARAVNSRAALTRRGSAARTGTRTAKASGAGPEPRRRVGDLRRREIRSTGQSRASIPDDSIDMPKAATR